MLDLDPADTRPIYRQIMDEIRRGIVLGTWPEGEPLPSVRQLASDLRVNPNTVQQAYRELEREGVVYVMRGQGTYVTAGAGRKERAPLLNAFTRRIVAEAYRSGFMPSELVAALQEYVKSERNHGGENS
jgi:GntR family transcriptional regulator